jgi:hypothetical protein
MSGLVLIHVVAAAGLDAIGAARAVLAPVDAAELPDPVKLSRSCRSVNVITVWHFMSLQINFLPLISQISQSGLMKSVFVLNKVLRA